MTGYVGWVGWFGDCQFTNLYSVNPAFPQKMRRTIAISYLLHKSFLINMLANGKLIGN